MQVFFFFLRLSWFSSFSFLTLRTLFLRSDSFLVKGRLFCLCLSFVNCPHVNKHQPLVARYLSLKKTRPTQIGYFFSYHTCTLLLKCNYTSDSASACRSQCRVFRESLFLFFFLRCLNMFCVSLCASEVSVALSVKKGYWINRLKVIAL